MFIVYLTDAWLSNDSRRAIALSNKLNLCLKLISEYCQKHEIDFTERDKENLEYSLQTQCSGRDVEFIIERVDVNKLIE